MYLFASIEQPCMDGSINRSMIRNPQGTLPGQANAQGSTFTDENGRVLAVNPEG